MRFARTNYRAAFFYKNTVVTGTEMYWSLERGSLLKDRHAEAIPHPEATLATSQASLLPEFRPRRWSGVKGLVTSFIRPGKYCHSLFGWRSRPFT